MSILSQGQGWPGWDCSCRNPQAHCQWSHQSCLAAILWFKSLNCLKSKASTLVPSLMLGSIHIDGVLRLMILVENDAEPERGRYRSLQCWRHCSKAHSRPPKIGSDKDHCGFNPLHFKCSMFEQCKQEWFLVLLISFIKESLVTSSHNKPSSEWSW